MKTTVLYMCVKLRAICYQRLQGANEPRSQHLFCDGGRISRQISTVHGNCADLFASQLPSPSKEVLRMAG